MNALELPLHFLRPWWWLALLPLPAVLWLLARGGGGRASWARIVDATLLPYLVHDGGTRRRLALALVTLAWVLAVGALSGPAWRKLPAPLYVNGAARVVVLSLSDDMLAQDLKPDRMARARFAVRDLLEEAGDARTALVAYAGAAFTVAPLTNDRRTVLNLLHALRPDVMPVPGNDAAAGIRRGTGLLQQAHVEGGEIVLVTDTADADAAAAARVARSAGVRVDVLGIGTTGGAPVPRSEGGFASGPGGLLMASRDDAALAAVARAGGGRYAVLQTNGGGTTAFGAPVAAPARASRGERAHVWRDGGIWLLPALVLVAALAFRRGWLLLVALLVTPAALPAAHASTWSSLWANRDQRALQALQRGDARTAQALARSPGVRGAADYRAGDYAAAARAFAQGSGARAQYDLGNALAKQRQYAKAIAAYRRALHEDPKFADARANLDAVEAWLRKHAPPPRPQGSQGQRNGRPVSGSPPASARQSGAPGANGKPVRGVQQQGSPNSSAASAARQGGNPAGKDRGGASLPEAERQRRQGDQAGQGLERELRRARGGQSGSPRAFALGQSEPRDEANLDASQRAMLRSVPDDPGALLRRKFRLEWEQRNGQRQENGQ